MKQIGATQWRLTEQRYRLTGEQCPDSGCLAFIFPPRDVCPRCGETVIATGGNSTVAQYKRYRALKNRVS